MLGKVILEVSAGPLAGQVFTFEEHETFIFGREKDCHAQLPEKDTTVSRHHFLLEANPPDARVQDLGSLNGTWVNGNKFGGRPSHMTPEEARRQLYPAVDLKDGDEIHVGKTVFRFRVEIPAVCHECGDSIPNKYEQLCKWGEGIFVCPDCRAKVEREGFSTRKITLSVCNRCGKDVSSEETQVRTGNYTCRDCRETAETDLAELLQIVMSRSGGRGETCNDFINDYEIIRKLGEGGMGAVYLARRKADGGLAAVKMLLSRIAVNDHNRKLFEREVEVTRSLRHPNIVELLEYCSAENIFCFTMEHCEGGSVWDLMLTPRRVLPLAQAGLIVLQTLEGLSHAHERNFVHRDIKPPNILLTAREGGVAKLADFGLAKNFQRAGLSGMTATGAVAGTFHFMPREQLINFKRSKPVSDVWSMGATFYFMLTGNTPLDFPSGQSPAEVVMSAEVVPIGRRDASIPEEVARVIDRAIAKDVEERYQTAAEFREALLKVL